MLQRGVQNVMI